MSELKKRKLDEAELTGAAGGGAGQHSDPWYEQGGPGEIIVDPVPLNEPCTCINLSCVNYQKEVKQRKTCPVCGGKLYPMLDYVKR